MFKTIADPYVGKISLFKVVSGTVRPDAVLFNPRSRSEERLHALFTLRGKEQLPLTEVPAGDIGAVAKLAATNTGDTLTPRNQPVTLVRPALPGSGAPAPAEGDGYVDGSTSWLADAALPVLSLAIRPKSKADEDKLMTALHRLQEEDPTLVVRRDDETHQTVLSGTGEAHIGIAMERLSRKFGVAVENEDLVIPYRETSSPTAEAEGKYKKQTGGHGQFGVASLRDRADGAGGGLRVRRQHRGRGDPPPVHPRRAKRGRGSHGRRRQFRLAGGRHPGHMLRRQAPPGRLLRDVVQDGRGAGRARGAGQGGPVIWSPFRYSRSRCPTPTRVT